MPDMPATQTVIAPLVKTVVVDLNPEAAFRLFAHDVARWWPLPTHSVFGENAAGCRLEGWVGGRFYEIHRNGAQQSEWGRVLAWEPPRRLLFSFYPGREPDSAQQVEVVFEPQAGGTRVTLTHKGWERLGDQAEKMRANYDTGWDFVLGHYVQTAPTYQT